jgi:hypothetical protein
MNNFSLMGHWKGDQFQYELQILNGDKIDMYPFKSSRPTQHIDSLQAAKSAECKCSEMGDVPGVSRLFGSFSEPTERDPAWLTFEGVTADTKEVYMPIEQGTVEVIHSENGKQFNFKSDKINGRWLMRTLPNIFDNGFIEGENMQLFWKPDNLESQMGAKLENAQMIPTQDLKGETTKLNSSMMTKEFTLASEQNEFDTIVAAEGTWIDKFGQKFTYTRDFIKTLYTNMSMQLEEGLVPIGVDNEHNKIDNGRMTALQLLDDPIAHIRGRGFSNGSLDSASGVSIDVELEAVFVPQFQSWFPVNGITKRVSLVASPACKVCNFIPK